LSYTPTESSIPGASLTVLQQSKECAGCWNFTKEDARWLKYVHDLKLLLPNVNFGPSGNIRNVLEIGCGTGSFLHAMKQLGVSGMCLAYENMPFVQTTNARGLIGAHMSTEHALPFPSHSFDMLHAHWVMAYLGIREDKLSRVLFEWDRLLRPSGYLVQRGFWHANVTHADADTIAAWAFVKKIAALASWNIIEWHEGPGVLDFIVQKPAKRTVMR
jgi:SAM-dependent methyltransferase